MREHVDNQPNGHRWRRRLTLAPVLAVSALAAVTALPAQAAVAAEAGGGSWAFDETSGTVAVDRSGFGNDGTLRGAVGLGQQGHAGTAFSFAAEGSWVEVPSQDSLNPGTEDFTFTAWVNLATPPLNGATYDIVRKGLTTTKGGEFKVEVIKNGLVRCTTKDAAKVRGAITGPRVNVANGAWHQIGCARVGNTWRVIVDNKVRSKTIALGSISNTKSLSIGSKYGQEDGTPGLVDDVLLTIG